MNHPMDMTLESLLLAFSLGLKVYLWVKIYLAHISTARGPAGLSFIYIQE